MNAFAEWRPERDLENYLRPELDLSTGRGIGDCAECRITYCCIGISVIHVVERVEGFPAQLQGGALS